MKIIITLSKNAYSLRDPCFPASASETSRNDVIRGRYYKVINDNKNFSVSKQ